MYAGCTFQNNDNLTKPNIRRLFLPCRKIPFSGVFGVHKKGPVFHWEGFLCVPGGDRRSPGLSVRLLVISWCGEGSFFHLRKGEAMRAAVADPGPTSSTGESPHRAGAGAGARKRAVQQRQKNRQLYSQTTPDSRLLLPRGGIVSFLTIRGIGWPARTWWKVCKRLAASLQFQGIRLARAHVVERP